MNDLFAEFQNIADNIPRESEEDFSSKEKVDWDSFNKDALNIEKGFSSWFRIIIVPLIYFLAFIEVTIIFYFVWAHFQEFNSGDLTIIFGAILAQSFLIVKIVTEKLYSNPPEKAAKNKLLVQEIIQELINRGSTT